MAEKARVVTVNGEHANLRVSCSCGWTPILGGADNIVLPVLQMWIKQHRKQGHTVDVSDPFGLMDGVNEPAMVS